MRTAGVVFVLFVVLISPLMSQQGQEPAQAVEGETEGPAEVTEKEAEEPQVTLTENLILNPSFEDELEAWQTAYVTGDVQIERDDRVATDGDYSLRLTSPTGQPTRCRLWQGPVEPGIRYRFKATYAATTEGSDDAEVAPAANISIRFGGEGETVGANVEFVTSSLAQDWEEAIYEFTTPPDADTATIDLWVYNRAGSVWFDEVEFGPLARGDQPLPAAIDGNLLFNGDMEIGSAGQPTGWVPGSHRNGIIHRWLEYDKQGRHVWTEENPHSGEHCLCCEVKDRDKVPYIYWQQYLTFKPDTEYKLSGYIRSEGRASCHIKAAFMEQRGLPREDHSTGYAGGARWHHVKTRFKTPEWDGLSRYGHIAVVGGGVGKFYVDDVRLEEVSRELQGVAIELTSEKLGNVFASPKDVKLHVTVKNETEGPLKLLGYYSVGPKDAELGAPIQLFELKELAAGETVEKDISAPVEDPGIYTLRVLISTPAFEQASRDFTFGAGE